MFRQEMQNLISNSSSPEEAAKLICVYFEDRMQPDGWFDDDPWWEDLSQQDYLELSRAMEDYTCEQYEDSIYESINAWLAGDDSVNLLEVVYLQAFKLDEPSLEISSELINENTQLIRRMFSGFTIDRPALLKELSQCLGYLLEERSVSKDQMIVDITQVRLKFATGQDRNVKGDQN